ncbi:MAG: UDP-N-acetylmuramoylalanyl-D-glutamyl-2,6-diaminopimelate--D-alanyl-D-alanine ligase [Alphaproteobacteria bacterium]|nr:UDP-N-acetylmuramoylalanyl-D-glutamyl-2,6-diaminopimelate--D-alanyl-D-alanine ligase [Alphaproteobacteria bacterium]
MTDILWTRDSVCAATDGQGSIDWSATGVSIDSRTVEKDDLFIALKGPRVDGHDHVVQALADGAAAALIDHRPNGLPDNAPVIEVADTMTALNDLGKTGRARSTAKIIAVTGSVGKTGTKDALRNALMLQGKTSASAHSYNNHWGVPLSLARLPADADYGVFEVGMNHAGEITPLSKMIRPDVSIITTVEPAHIEFFDSIEAIADAKAEIFAGMNDGTAILNRDNPLYVRIAKGARSPNVARTLSFGENPEADARLITRVADSSGNNVEAVICGRRIGYRLGLPGQHLVQNSLAVLAAICAVDADVAAAAKTLSELTPIAGRGARRIINVTDGSFTIIDESYNANPASMRAAMETLAAMRPEPCAKRIAVLGDMRELGKNSHDYHVALADTLVKNGIDKVFACGSQMAAMFETLPDEMRGGFRDSAELLGETVATRVKAGDIVTVKGSLASGMKTVVDQLSALQINTVPKPGPALNGAV